MSTARPRALRDPEKAAEAELLLASGHPQREVARKLGVGNGTVARFSQERQDRIEALRQQIQERVSERVLERIEEATEAQMAAASDPACKHGPQAYRAALEGAGLAGKAQFHIGDNYVDASVQMDLSQHAVIQADPARLAELRARLEAAD